MRLISGSCRRAEARVERGFTLLELLLVMALVALLTGLVAPRMWQWVQSARQRSELDAARAALEALPRQAFSHASRMTVDTKVPLKLPAGWGLELSAPLVYEANGMTIGGRVRINADRAVLADWIIVAPAGAVRNAEPADGAFRVEVKP